MELPYKVHETAIVDKGAEIGANSRIWHWVHISSGARIGEGCSFGQNVFVGSKVAIVGSAPSTAALDDGAASESV